MKQMLIISLPLFLIFSCQTKDRRDNKIAINDTLFEEGLPVTTIENPALQEASGLAVSRTNPGYLWTHNDSGDGPHLYLINRLGEISMQVTLEGITAVDWEEMSIQTLDSLHYLLIGDIGDNQAKRSDIQIHRIKEPRFISKEKSSIAKNEVETLTIKYSEGARDAESFFYDPADQQILLITKREENVMIYQFPFTPGKKAMTIQSLGNIPWRNFTSADVLPNGDILAKNYETIFYWSRKDSAVKSILENNPIRIPYIQEPQGEAITTDATGGFYTLSEHNVNTQQKLYYYQSKN